MITPAAVRTFSRKLIDFSRLGVRPPNFRAALIISLTEYWRRRQSPPAHSDSSGGHGPGPPAGGTPRAQQQQQSFGPNTHSPSYHKFPWIAPQSLCYVVLRGVYLCGWTTLHIFMVFVVGAVFVEISLFFPLFLFRTENVRQTRSSVGWGMVWGRRCSLRLN